MPADAPANPNANQAAKDILNLFWDASQNGLIITGSQTSVMDAGEWWHPADNTTYTEFEQFNKTVGRYPKVISFPGEELGTNQRVTNLNTNAVPFTTSSTAAMFASSPTEVVSGFLGNSTLTKATGTSQSDIIGCPPLDPNGAGITVFGKMIDHARKGGIVKIMAVPPNPTAWVNSTVSLSGATTYSAIKSATAGTYSSVIKIRNGEYFGASTSTFSAYPMSNNGGYFVIVDSTGLPWFGSYTAVVEALTNTLYNPSVTTAATNAYLAGVQLYRINSSGTFIECPTSTSFLANAAVSVAKNKSGQSSMTTTASTNIWHLIWNNTDCITQLNADLTAAGQTTITNATTAYTGSLAQNANQNFNRWLDYVASICNILDLFNIPVILRLYPEPNIGLWWYNAGNTRWFGMMWKYIVAYLSNNPTRTGSTTPIGYTGQPVVGSTGVLNNSNAAPFNVARPVNNAIFMWGQAMTTATVSTTAPPRSDLVDLIGVEWYKSSNGAGTSFNSMQAYPGMSTKPIGVSEFYPNVTTATVGARGVCMNADDLASATIIGLYTGWYQLYTKDSAGNAFSTYGFDKYFGSTVSASAPGHVMVPTVNGLMQVKYTACTVLPNNYPDPQSLGYSGTTAPTFVNRNAYLSGTIYNQNDFVSSGTGYFLCTVNGNLNAPNPSGDSVTAGTGWKTIPTMLDGYLLSGLTITTPSLGTVPNGSYMIPWALATQLDASANLVGNSLQDLKNVTLSPNSPNLGFIFHWDGTTGQTDQALYLPTSNVLFQDKLAINLNHSGWRYVKPPTGLFYGDSYYKSNFR